MTVVVPTWDPLTTCCRALAVVDPTKFESPPVGGGDGVRCHAELIVNEAPMAGPGGTLVPTVPMPMAVPLS